VPLVTQPWTDSGRLHLWRLDGRVDQQQQQVVVVAARW
jgi:hypothetical protein